MIGKSGKCRNRRIYIILIPAALLVFLLLPHMAFSQERKAETAKSNSPKPLLNVYPEIENISGDFEIEMGPARFKIENCRVMNIRISGEPVITILSRCRGALHYDPPDDVEARQLENYTGIKRLDDIFDDGNIILIAENMASDTPVFSYSDLLKSPEYEPLYALADEFYQETGRNIIIDLMQGLFSREPGSFYFANIHLYGAGRLAFCLSGDRLSLYNFGRYRLKKIADVVNDFRFGADSGAAINEHVDIARYNIVSKIADSGKMLVNCRVYFTVDSGNCRFLRFEWSDKNELISALDSSGDSLEIVSRRDRGNVIWRGRLENEFGVILKNQATPFKEDYIDIKYDCGVFANYYGNFVPEVMVNAYPFKSVKYPGMYNINMFSLGYFWNTFVDKLRSPWWDNIEDDFIYDLYEDYLKRGRVVDGFLEFDMEDGNLNRTFGAKKVAGEMPEFAMPYDNVFLDASPGWYPEPCRRDLAAFKLTFECPDEFRVVSCGSETRGNIEGDKFVSCWAVEDSVERVDFAVGNFTSREKTGNPSPPVKTYLTKNFDFNELGDIYARMGRLSYSDKAGFVCAAVSEYCDYYTDHLGKYDIDTLRVVSSCLTGHGYSSHGFIAIPWEKFQFEDFDCRSRMFIGHQVAHQWWGEMVKPADYKDDWIIEGLSEYCAYRCTENLCESHSGIEDLLDEMRTAAVKGGGMYSNGSRTGSVTLGKRLLSSDSDDYYPVVYAKAAYIFHMIRYMLYDFKTESEEPFIRFLQDLVRCYKDRDITTADLQLLLEKHTGRDMERFFDQWVYGCAIPHYHFEYRTDPVLDGRYKVHCFVRQEYVPYDFEADIPVTVIFDQGRYIHLKIRVDKPLNQIELPLLPYYPKKIIFNTYDAILCR